MPGRLQYTKFIVTIGFIILICLSSFGIYLIYKELIKFSEVSDTTKERQELVLISNTLASLYNVEGVGSFLISETQSSTKKNYDSLMIDLHIQVDSLKKLSTDPKLHLHLDSVITLLDLKRVNMNKMFQLLDSIKNPQSTQTVKTTVLSKKNIDDLDQILKKTIENKDDTVIVTSGKKSFYRRFKDLFDRNAADSSTRISKKQIENIDSIIVPTATDTIVQYVNEFIQMHQLRNNKITQKLIIRQSLMHTMNEQLTTQINKILREIEQNEYQTSFNILKEKEITLNRSSEIVSTIGILALVTSIIFLVLILRSITKSQQYRRELEKSKKYADELLSAREGLILTITHDIKAPISSIIGYIELLLKSKPPEKEHYYIENMQNSAEHVLQLVKNLLDYHALESDRKDINTMSFFPCILMNDIYDSFVPLANKNDQILEFKCNVDKEISYENDPYRIRQIVNNLMSNAIKFTPEKGKITLKIAIQNINEGYDRMSISVKDNGPGISEEDKLLIFEEFRRSSKIDQVKIEGSGLGLTITRKLVHLLNGEIHLISSLGNGSEFIVEIPVKRNKNKIINKQIEKNKSVSLDIDPNKKILFIDDDVVQLSLYSELLKKEGLITKVCANSIDALAILQTTKFDMVFSDIQMPDMNGFELVERIRMGTFEGSKTIPVIALSASSQISEQKFEEAGFSGFLAKPFTSNDILNMIQKFIGKSTTDCYSMPRRADEPKGFSALLSFASDDNEAGYQIIKSFIEENEKNINALEVANEDKDWVKIRQLCHKMLPLMRMISATDVVYALCEFERGSTDTDKVKVLIELIKNLLQNAKNFLSGMK